MFSKYPAKNLITFKNYDVVFSQKKYLVCLFFLARNLSKSDEFGYLFEIQVFKMPEILDFRVPEPSLNLSSTHAGRCRSAY